ncbi:hypothetical protein GCM10009775_23780 [Microbacterium aoyamense]|uniref:EthD domain-containing protein n=1 Tax=Microbacterium aoyamense TaxID=344166 RepID=A0ABN2PVE1_9MICO|nr:EthD family reductase [Microbacterium aoyamense]
MIKMVALITRRADLDREEFLRIWQDEHTALVERLPGLRGYRQNPAIAHHRPWPYDGMVELWFDDVDAARIAFGSPAGRVVHDHERTFVATVETLVVEERTVVDPSQSWRSRSSDNEQKRTI